MCKSKAEAQHDSVGFEEDKGKGTHQSRDAEVRRRKSDETHIKTEGGAPLRQLMVVSTISFSPLCPLLGPLFEAQARNPVMVEAKGEAGTSNSGWLLFELFGVSGLRVQWLKGARPILSRNAEWC